VPDVPESSKKDYQHAFSVGVIMGKKDGFVKKNRIG